LLFLLPVLLNAGPLVVIEQPVNEKDGPVIQVARFQDKVSSSLRQLQIKYGFDVVYVSVVPVIRQILSGDSIAGTSFDPTSPDLRNYPDRGPPHLSAIL
jgi:tetrahydromethanopterin S-methyltransferase subunit B